MSDIDMDTLLVVGFILLIFLFGYLTVTIGLLWTLLGYFMAFIFLIYLVGKRSTYLEKKNG